MRLYGWILIFSCTIIACSRTENKIAIQPLGNVPTEILDSIQHALKRETQHQIVMFKPIAVPNRFITIVKSTRYRADSIIHHLKKIQPDSIDYTIGVTLKDISCTKKENGEIKKPTFKYADWGICGLGFLNGPTCVISTFRIKHKDKSIFYSRLQKISVHEIGHNAGLPHCSNENCVMRDAAESVSTIDNVKSYYCLNCKKKL